MEVFFRFHAPQDLSVLTMALKSVIGKAPIVGMWDNTSNDDRHVFACTIPPHWLPEVRAEVEQLGGIVEAMVKPLVMKEELMRGKDYMPEDVYELDGDIGPRPPRRRG